MTEPESSPSAARTLSEGRPGLAVLLFFLTLASTTYVGRAADGEWQSGFAFSLPLMAILLAHELGHYIAARIHRVPSSPPYFIPVPLPPLGTMGAVILMPDRIRSRNALLDIGAAGPLAGLCVALPVLVYGLLTSEVGPQVAGEHYQEGHSLLYAALLYLIKGPIPEGHDIWLNATAFAGWAGLLVTMLNLIPALQLDGGHVAHALLGPGHEVLSRIVRNGLFVLALGVAVIYGGSAYAEGKRGDALYGQLTAAMQWLMWAVLLRIMARGSPREHPPTDGDALTPVRRVVASFTLGLFVLLFMPAWLRFVVP